MRKEQKKIDKNGKNLLFRFVFYNRCRSRNRWIIHRINYGKHPGRLERTTAAFRFPGTVSNRTSAAGEILPPLLFMIEFLQCVKSKSVIPINRQQLAAKLPDLFFLSIEVTLLDTFLHPRHPQCFKLLTIFLTGCQY